MTKSFAYKITSKLQGLEKLLIHIKNKKIPKTFPRGTPITAIGNRPKERKCSSVFIVN